MQIIGLENKASHSVETIPENSVMVFGFFDGVHLGHRQLINTALDMAEARPVVIWTLKSMPKIPSGSLLTTNHEKCDIMRSLGVKHIIFEDFEEICSLSGKEFFLGRIFRNFKPSCVVCGFNFRFGKNASCTANDLLSFSEELGIKCQVVSSVRSDGQTVSSSLIRDFIREGNMEAATRLLGRPYSLSSEVIHGKRIGHSMGFPTANQRFSPDKLIPPFGVYSCIAEYDSCGTAVSKHGVCNIGSRPTVNSDTGDVTLETYIFDCSEELYEKEIRIFLVEMLRPEIKFSDIGELSEQIAKDKESAKKSLHSKGY